MGLVAAAQTVFCVSKEVPREILEWIEKHPGQTAFIIIAGTVFFVPELITVPVLWSLGFTKEGVVGGEFLLSLFMCILTFLVFVAVCGVEKRNRGEKELI